MNVYPAPNPRTKMTDINRPLRNQHCQENSVPPRIMEGILKQNLHDVFSTRRNELTPAFL